MGGLWFSGLLRRGGGHPRTGRPGRHPTECRRARSPQGAPSEGEAPRARLRPRRGGWGRRAPGTPRERPRHARRLGPRCSPRTSIVGARSGKSRTRAEPLLPHVGFRGNRNAFAEGWTPRRAVLRTPLTPRVSVVAPSPSPSCEMNGTITRNAQLHGVLRPMTHPEIKPQEFPQSQRCLRSAGPLLGRPRAPRCPSALGPRGPEATWAGSARGSPERGDERPPAASRLCPTFFVREGERVAVPRHPCHRHFCGHAPWSTSASRLLRAVRAPLGREGSPRPGPAQPSASDRGSARRID